MIEQDGWILSVSLDDHEEMVGSIERVMADSGAAVSVCLLGNVPEVPMSNHSRRATLRTVSGAQRQHAGADVTRLVVAVGELQKHGMTVVMWVHMEAS